MSRLREESRSQFGVDVVEGETARNHQHLRPVQELADLPGQRVITLVLGGEPHLASLLEDLLAKPVHPTVQCLDGATTCRTGARALAEFGEQRVEGLHGRRLFHAYRSEVTPV